MSSTDIAARYNAVPYPRFIFYQTHPNRLATVGYLLSMDVADITQCRVLELGCASGANLLPMAAQLPQSEFVGIDLAAVQIAEGQRMIEALGLENVRLLEMNLLDFPEEMGQFDYIIAHGLFSWVPLEVQQAILALCKRHLAPHGIAYISYNTYPGWHVTDSIRDLMRFHTRNIDDPIAKTDAALEVVQWAQTVLSDEHNHAFGALLDVFQHQLADQLHRIQSRDASSLLHDELSDFNQPYYFYEFMQMATAHGLQYLAESHFAAVMPSDLSPETIVELNHLAGRDLIRREQYMDYLRNRRFRQTLLVHDDVTLQRSISPEKLRRLFITTKAEPLYGSDPHRLPTHFTTPRGLKFDVENAATAAALVALHASAPIALSVGELLAAVRNVLGLETIPLDAVNVLLVDLLHLFSIHEEFITLRVWRPTLPVEPPSPAQVWSVARLFAEGDDFTVNLWHERIGLTPLAKRLLPYLDGQHDHAALIEVMRGWLEGGQLSIEEPHPSDERIVYLLSKEIDKVLEWLMANALLLPAE